MQAALVSLRAHVDVLQSNALAPSTGKRVRGGKTDRLNAIIAIHEAADKRTVIDALTAATKLDLVVGPADPDADPDCDLHLTWCELLSVLLDTLDVVLSEATAAKSVARSGVASVKPDFMRCFRLVLRNALKHVPPGALRPLVPATLHLVNGWLADPPLRALLADDLWQIVRDLLAHACNRAMLQPKMTRTWVDTCFEQLTARGALYHRSDLVTHLAGEVLQLLATPVESYDVLAQSAGGVTRDKMRGGDFSYAIIAERCCAMLALTPAMPSRVARDVYPVAFRTLALVLADHALDVADSVAVKAIVGVALQPLLLCWKERKFHDAAVSLAHMLTLLAPNHKGLRDELRKRVLGDGNASHSSAIVRAGNDVKDDYIFTAAACFSFREALEFASRENGRVGHLILWMRVAHAIMSRRVLKKGTSVQTNSADVFEQCAKGAEVMTELVKAQGKARGMHFSNVIYWACKVIDVCSFTANKILNAGLFSGPFSTNVWGNLYHVLRDLLTTMSYDSRSKNVGYSRSAEPSDSESSLLRSASLLCGMKLVETSALEISAKADAGSKFDIPYPVSKMLAEGRPSPLEIEYFRNLVARTGLIHDDGASSRIHLLDSLIGHCVDCVDDKGEVKVSVSFIMDASAAAATITRGECRLKPESLSKAPVLFSGSDLKGPSSLSMSTLRSVRQFSGLSYGTKRITSEGPQLVQMIRDQDSLENALYGKSRMAPDGDASTASFFDSDMNVTANGNLTRHKAVDHVLGEELEGRIKTKLRQCANGIMGGSSDQDGQRRNNRLSTVLRGRGPPDLSATRRAIGITLFATNYLHESIQADLAAVESFSSTQESQSRFKIIDIVVDLLSALAETKLEHVHLAAGNLPVCIRASLDLYQLLINRAGRATDNSSWIEYVNKLNDVLVKLASNYTASILEKVVEETKETREKLQSVLQHCLDGFSSMPSNTPRAHKRRRVQRNDPNKRQRFLQSPTSSHHSGMSVDRDRDDDDLRMPDDHNDDDDDSGSEYLDGFAEDSANTPRKSSSDQNGGNHMAQEFNYDYIVEVVGVISRAIHSVREPVRTRCERTLSQITREEGILSPDGIARPAMFSPILSENYLKFRCLVWNLLHNLGDTKAEVTAGLDICKVGTFWKQLEAMSQQYAAHYVELLHEGTKRKQYPVPMHLEEVRDLFLKHGCRFVDQLLRDSSLDVSEFLPVSKDVYNAMYGIVQTVDFFRRQHAFRMPRNIRVGFLRFGHAIISKLSNPRAKKLMGQLCTEDQLQRMNGVLKLIHSAMLKSVAEADASVRLFAARLVPSVLCFESAQENISAEQLLHDCLPPHAACHESDPNLNEGQNDGENDEEHEMYAKWNISDEYRPQLSLLHRSFMLVGSRAKGCSSLVTLAELCAGLEDSVPYSLTQLFSRLKASPWYTGYTYFLLSRVCAARHVSSPSKLFQVYSRVVLPRMFDEDKEGKVPYEFPVALVRDKGHHSEGAGIDWAISNQSMLLPHLLVRETSHSLQRTSEFAKFIASDLKSVLQDNVGSFSLIFPMQFSAKLYKQGRVLWNAIDEVLDGKSFEFFKKRKDEVISELLRSTSSGSVQIALPSTESEDEVPLGFQRDTTSLSPPLYDPLIIALAINHLYVQSTNIFILPEEALKGSLFAEVYEKDGNSVIADRFEEFLVECRRQNTTLLRSLLTVSKQLDSSSGTSTSQGRKDAYFSVGMLWRMLSVSIFMKPTNERRAFYKLISYGFNDVNTARDASWLLFDVHEKLLNLDEQTNKEFSLSASDLALSADQMEHLSSLSTSRERHIYELLSTASPILVSIVLNPKGHDPDTLQKVAMCCLTELVRECADQNLWAVILANGPFPKGKELKEVGLFYEKAVVKMDGGPAVASEHGVLSCLKRLCGIHEQRRYSNSSLTTLACLQELRDALTESNVMRLSILLRQQGWRRDSGNPEVHSDTMSSSISAVLELLQTVHQTSKKDMTALRALRYEASRASSDGVDGQLQIHTETYRTIADVLHTLGLLHPHSVPFIHLGQLQCHIPPLEAACQYEDRESGIRKALFILLDLLRSGPAVVSECALNVVISLLQTRDGKSTLALEIRNLEAIRSLRVSGRTSGDSVFTTNSFDNLIDPKTGEVWRLSSLPSFMEPEAWSWTTGFSGSKAEVEEWTSTITTVLAANCNSPALKSLTSVCFASYRMSCEMLPYILFDIVENLDGEGLRKLSAIIRENIILNPATPVSVLRIFVHSLDVLCQIGLRTLNTQDLTALVRSSSISGRVPCLYKFEIPYPEVIRAALRCGSHFSAIRFSHFYVDQRVHQLEARKEGTKEAKESDRRQSSGGVLRDPNSVTVEQESLNEIKPWVFEAISQIRDVDGIKAFSHGESFSETTASIGKLEKNWPVTLSALAVISRNDCNAGQPGPELVSGGHKERLGVDLDVEFDTLQSLMSFGSVKMVAQQWDSIVMQVAQGGIRAPEADRAKLDALEQLNELRFAAAWKLQRWESPQVLAKTSLGEKVGISQGCGFHEAIFKVLHGFKKGRPFEVPELVSHARDTILHELCEDYTLMSTERLHEDASRLRVLHVLDQARMLSKTPNTVIERGATPNISCAPLLGVEQAHPQSHPTANEIASTIEGGSQRFSRQQTKTLDLDQLFGSAYGISDLEVKGVVPSRDAFLLNNVTEELPVVLLRCIGYHERVAEGATTASARILEKNDRGSWARSAASLGIASSSFSAEVVTLDDIACKVQEARLQWRASQDASLRKKALALVKNLISDHLGGVLVEQRDANSSGNLGDQQTLTWAACEGDAQKLAILRSEACCLAANWSLDMRSQEPLDLFETYLIPALKATCALKGGKMFIGRTYFSLASFADQQLSNIDAYRKSRKFADMMDNIKGADAHLQKLRAMKQQRSAKSRTPVRRRSRALSDASGTGNDKVGKDLDYLIGLEAKKLSMDKAKLNQLNSTYMKWQHIACEHFAASLRCGTPHDLRAAFRMVAIWVDSKVMRERITRSLVQDRNSQQEQGVHVPVSKLLPLAPQLFSRLNHSENVGGALFQKTLSKTMEKLAGKHPAHCLWQLLALSNATRVCGVDEKMSSLYTGDKDKKDAAEAILTKLHSDHGSTVYQMRRVADAYIRLSERSQKIGEDKKTIDLRRSELYQLGRIPNVPVPTVPLPLFGSDEHESLPYMVAFDKTAGVCAGLSKPFKVKCLGSDGKHYPQIVKGRDDLRGDAVMQQMFTIVNSLLESDSDASRRSLHIRTYRIVPLSPFSGIMQFVDNTRQFKEVLTEGWQGTCARPKSLHERYRPHDMKHEKVQKKAFNEYRLYKSKDGEAHKRLRFMRFVWTKFQPVFRHFFTEQWPDPADWYVRQQAYSRSMAVMSFVGFILGIGDRHLSNILFDVRTGQVVHIDFGVSFEAGKMLPTPEQMPFRLSRDLADGFGISGVEGAFRKCSEITLALMRKHKDVLVTVLEVLLHDPMYNWDLTPEEVLREQMGDGQDVGSDGDDADSDAVDAVSRIVEKNVKGSRDAQRALNRVLEKLDGLEGTERLSVEAHVARLIDEAQAFHVLGPVFPGWSGWV